MVIRPEAIRVLSASTSVIKHYQKHMSKAVWRPATGKKLGFLVVQDEFLLGLIFLGSPVVTPVAARNSYLFPEAKQGPAFAGDPKFTFNKKGKLQFDYGSALKDYMDMSVCVAAQPIGWHWHLGKLMAMIAYTLGDYVEDCYPDQFNGVTTTSLYGGNKATQYTRIYKHLGETKGYGHEQVSDEEYEDMVDYLRDHGLPIPSARHEDGSNVRWRRITAYRRAVVEKVNLKHGHKRGIYYHPAVPPEQRAAIIQNWFERWGLPRYAKTKNLQPPYQCGLDGRSEVAA